MTKEQEIYERLIAARYMPQDTVRKRVLEAGYGHTLRFASQNPPRLELNIQFEHRQDADLLGAIENDLCQLTEAYSFRIFPHYPPSEFGVGAMREIFEEAAKIGAVANGFFYEATTRDDGECLTVEIPFSAGGVAFVSRTEGLLSAIIANRYGVSRRVVITSCEDALERTAARERAKDEEEKKRLLSTAPTVQAAPKAAADVKEKVDRTGFRREMSVMGGGGGVAYQEGSPVVTIGDRRFDIGAPSPILGAGFVPQDPVSIADAYRMEGKTVVLLGEVFSVKLNEVGRANERTTVVVGIGDGTSSIYARRTFPNEAIGWATKLKPGTQVAVRGRIYREQTAGNELSCALDDMVKITRLYREDNEEEKRVELHLHTNMSTMDGLTRPEEIVDAAKRWGHTAIGITDHGTVQAFPEVMLKAEESYPELKVLYGKSEAKRS